jgi:hypothetical protein
MIVCSCQVISDEDIERALADILSAPDAPLPTPGVVYRRLAKRMVCCGCSPLAVRTIYEKIDALAARGVLCPYACANARDGLNRRAQEKRVKQHASAGAHPAWHAGLAADAP